MEPPKLCSLPEAQLHFYEVGAFKTRAKAEKHQWTLETVIVGAADTDVCKITGRKSGTQRISEVEGPVSIIFTKK